jgi:hypothetical protein
VGVLVSNIDAVAGHEQLLRDVPGYVRFLANLMGLPHWKIHIEAADGHGDAYAEIFVTDNRAVAVMRLYPPFFQASEEDQRHSLVHELLHPRLHPVRVHFDALRPTLGGLLFDPLKKGQDDCVETIVDGVADFLSPLLPTIPQWRQGYRPSICLPGGTD